MDRIVRPPVGDGNMRVCLLVVGSRGDVQPFLAIGVLMRKRGHDVRFFACSDACAMVEEFGFKAVEIAKAVDAWSRSDECKAAMELGDWGSISGKIHTAIKLDETEEAFRERMDRELKSFQPTCLVFNTLGLASVPFLFCYTGGAARLNLELQPQGFASNNYRSLVFHRELPDPSTPNILTHLWAIDVTDDIVDYYHKGLGTKSGESRKDEFFRLMDERPSPEERFEFHFEPDTWLHPRFFAYSPSFYPNPKDWPASDRIKVLGALKLDPEWQEEQVSKGSKYFSVGTEFEQCKLFIARVGAPVYIGWGSMFVYSTEHMTLLAVEAVRKAGEKAIILSGWGKLGLDGLAGAPDEQGLRDYCQENVLFIKAAPLDLLLPHCKAAVHHGGIGTLQTSMLAACPTVVTPVFSDQFDNAKHCAQCGCGVATTRLGLLKSDELSKAIKTIVSDASYKTRVTEMAQGMRKENGAVEFVDWVEQYHKEVIVTGQIAQKLIAWKERLFEKREKTKKQMARHLHSKFYAILMDRYPCLREYNATSMEFTSQAMKLVKEGKLWWTNGSSVLARVGEGLKTEEAGRFKRYTFLQELDKRGTRLYVKKLKGRGPEKGWVTCVVKGKDVISKITEVTELSSIGQQQMEELFDDKHNGKDDSLDG